jgi:hypothetical protein
MFFTKKKSPEMDVTTLTLRVNRLEVRINELETANLGIISAQKLIRDKVLRRFKKDSELFDQEQPVKEKELNTNPYWSPFG